jgi:hypothetical protein
MTYILSCLKPCYAVAQIFQKILFVQQALQLHFKKETAITGKARYIGGLAEDAKIMLRRLKPCFAPGNSFIPRLKSRGVSWQLINKLHNFHLWFCAEYFNLADNL